MRRHISLALLAVFVILGVVASMRSLSSKTRAASIVASAASDDTITRVDSATESEPRYADTLCLASRIGLPCDPR